MKFKCLLLLAVVAPLIATSQDFPPNPTNDSSRHKGQPLSDYSGGSPRVQLPNSSTLYASDFHFGSTSVTDLSQPGAKTVTLTSCPPGVFGNEKDYWVYISGTGTAEAVLVTGGTCAGNGSPGTLRFTTGNAHTAGYIISSASSGIAEAVTAAGYIPRVGAVTWRGIVVAPAGNYPIYGQLTIKGWGRTIDFSAGLAQCYSSTTPCLYIGDAANSNNTLDVTIVGFSGWPKAVKGTQPMIEVNAQKTRLVNLGGMYDPGGGTFGYWVKVNDDQAFLIDGLSTTTGLGNIRCDSTFCGSIVWANGSFNSNPQRAPVGWIKNSNFSLQCMGNGIDWQSGNTLRVSDTVIQGYPHFGIRYSMTQGGYGGLQVENVYEEYGSGCGAKGPVAINNAAAGVIMQGYSPYTNPSLSIRGGEGPQGNIPTFATGGATTNYYYVIGVKANGDRTSPLFFGQASPLNGSTSVLLKWYDLSPSATYDILVTSGPGGDNMPAPVGTGNYAVVTGLSQATACSGGVCSFTDRQAARVSYTITGVWLGQATGPKWAPKLDLWPGTIILSPTTPADLSAYNHPSLVTDLYGMGQTVISAAGGVFPQIYAQQCWHTSASGLSPYNWPVCPGGTTPWNQLKLMAGIQAGGQSSLQNLKGVLNIGGNTATNGPTHLITLFDYTPEVSQAYGNGRAPNSAHDTFLGIDSIGTNSNVGLSLGSYYSISNYIGNVGDGKSWLERLTRSAKSFQVPVNIGVQTGTPPLTVASTTPVDNLTLSNHPTLHNCGGTSVCSRSETRKGQIVYGRVTLSSGKAVVTGIAPQFSSAGTFECTTSDRTFAGNAVSALPLSGTSVEFHGAGSDTIAYICVGN